MKRFVQSEIRINVEAQRIIEALINVEDLRQWWGVDSAFIEAKDLGLYTLTWLRSEDGIKFIQTGRIGLLNPRSHIHLEGILYLNSAKPILGPFKINYDVESYDRYSILRVTQSGFKKGKDWDWYYQATMDGWPHALSLLKQYLEIS